MPWVGPYLGSAETRTCAMFRRLIRNGSSVIERFLRDADLIGVQRHLKVIGIFARLHHRDGKPKYLADVPRFFAYLDDVLPRYPQLAGLADFIDARVKPAIAARAGCRRWSSPPALANACGR